MKKTVIMQLELTMSFDFENFSIGEIGKKYKEFKASRPNMQSVYDKIGKQFLSNEPIFFPGLGYLKMFDEKWEDIPEPHSGLTFHLKNPIIKEKSLLSKILSWF